MSVNDWLQGEIYIKQQLPWVVLGILFLFFIVVFCLLYFIKSHKKRAQLIISGCLLLSSGLAFSMYQHINDYTFYIHTAKDIPFITQKFEKSLLIGEKDYSQLTHQPLQKHIPALDAFVLYQKTEALQTKDLTYLGKDATVTYFKLYNTVYHLENNSSYIVYDENTPNVYIQTVSYTLKDCDFTQAGFYENIGPIYLKLVVPASQKNLLYENNNKTRPAIW